MEPHGGTDQTLNTVLQKPLGDSLICRIDANLDVDADAANIFERYRRRLHDAEENLKR